MLSNWQILSILFPDWHLKRNRSVNNIFPVRVTSVHKIPLNQILKETVCFMTSTNYSIKRRFWYVYPGRLALSSASFENHLLFVWTVHSHEDETKPFKNPSQARGWKALLLIQALGCAFESCLLRWLWRLSVVSDIQRKQSADPPIANRRPTAPRVCVYARYNVRKVACARCRDHHHFTASKVNTDPLHILIYIAWPF